MYLLEIDFLVPINLERPRDCLVTNILSTYTKIEKN